jgi:hypothetical protein
MDEVIGVVLFAGTIATTVVLLAFFRYKHKVKVQETVRTALERGQELSPELLTQLMSPPPLQRGNADLRRGIMAVALGVAIGAFAFVVAEGDGDVIRPILGVACLPIALGLAYLGLWKLGSEK